MPACFIRTNVAPGIAVVKIGNLTADLGPERVSPNGGLSGESFRRGQASLYITLGPVLLFNRAGSIDLDPQPNATLERLEEFHGLPTFDELRELGDRDRLGAEIAVA